jgi:hypothetical protein
MMRQSLKTLTEQDLETFPLLKYAAQSWFYHSALQGGDEIGREVSLLQCEPARDDWLILYSPETPKARPFYAGEEEGRPTGSAIYYAAILGLPVVVTSLVRDGADVDGRGGRRSGNALQAASGTGKKEMVQLLLELGANVNANCGFFGNALQCASLQRGNKEVVQLLLDKGANVNAEGGVWGSALKAASYWGYEETKQLLLDNGAIVNEGVHWFRGRWVCNQDASAA